MVDGNKRGIMIKKKISKERVSNLQTLKTIAKIVHHAAGQDHTKKVKR